LTVDFDDFSTGESFLTLSNHGRAGGTERTSLWVLSSIDHSRLPDDLPEWEASDPPLERRLLRRQAEAQRRRRRRLLALDVAIAAALAGILVAVLPGLGVVAWFALPLLVLMLVAGGAAKLVGRGRRRRARRRPAGLPHPPA